MWDKCIFSWTYDMVQELKLCYIFSNRPTMQPMQASGTINIVQAWAEVTNSGTRYKVFGVKTFSLVSLDIAAHNWNTVFHHINTHTPKWVQPDFCFLAAIIQPILNVCQWYFKGMKLAYTWINVEHFIWIRQVFGPNFACVLGTIIWKNTVFMMPKYH